MKRVLMAFAVLVFAFSSAAFGQAKSKTGSVEKMLMQIEEELVVALVKGNMAAVEPYLASTFVFTAPDGTTQDRAQWLADWKTGTVKLESSVIDDMKVQVFGTTAVVNYRSVDKGTYKGNDISGPYRWTDVFVKRNGRWQIVSSQGTSIGKK